MSMLRKIRKPIVLTLLALLAVSYYLYLSNREVNNSENITQDLTPASEAISRDLELNYPKTPRSVVEYYSDIITIWYKEEITEDELVGLAQHARGLFDEELLEVNEYNQYMSDLKSEIELYNQAGRYITDYEIADGYGIDYTSYNGEDYARVPITYFVRANNDIIKTYEIYTLRKDDEGSWKILYWELTDASSME